MNDDVTDYLLRWSEGEAQALDDLVPIIYTELGQIASTHLRKERRDHTLPTSALVHEAYLKLIDQDRMAWRNRSHFFAIASQVMRRMLVDHARTRGRAKRGGGAVLLPLDEALEVGGHSDDSLLALDDALVELAKIDRELVEVIELRFFGGMDNTNIARLQGVSERTVIRRWRTAQAWLLRHLSEAQDAS
ncbi:MAG: ECF-type sigma factor [Acidobacteriota bacterium]